MAREIEFQILGKNFAFNLPSDMKVEDFMQIARYVEDKINRIRAEASELDSFKLGLLTALNVAEELFALQRENESLKTILNKIDTIITPMDEEIPPGDDKKGAIRFSS
jgi:cell division protein ZapA